MACSSILTAQNNKREFTHIDSALVAPLKVYKLDLSFKGLKSTTVLSQFENLEELNLSGNRLDQLPLEIQQLKNLKTLKLADNLIAQLPDFIKELSQLEILSLENNNLKSFPVVLCELPLKELNLRNNEIDSIPSCISNLENLELLNLRFNKVALLPSAIGNLKKLQTLELVHNKLTKIPNSAGALTNLKVLNLTANQLTSLPTSIGQLSHLQILNLHNNSLKELPSEIVNLKSLKHLYITKNEIPFLRVEKYQSLLPQSIVHSHVSGEIFHYVEEMPLFPAQECEDLKSGSREKKVCSDQKLMEYITNNCELQGFSINYKASLLVVISFIVEDDGSIQSIKISRTPSDELGNEALRIIKKMQQEHIWLPGKQRGKNVRVKVNVPIRFEEIDD